MCGRATLSSPVEDVAALFDAAPIAIGPPRFNIAPTQPLVTVRSTRRTSPPAPSSSTGSPSSPSAPAPLHPRQLAMVRWGLIPFWAKPEEAKRIASRCIQARAESVTRAAAFRDAFRRHRCLVVVDGFFEWKTLPDGSRVPHHARRGDRRPFAIAALWDRWRDPREREDEGEQDVIESCAVLTTRSAGPLRALHDRMPLVLNADEWNTWLEGSEEDAAALLKRDEAIEQREADLVVVPVSTWVNNVRHDDPRCIEPAKLGVDASVDASEGANQMDFGFSRAAPGRRARRGS